MPVLCTFSSWETRRPSRKPSSPWPLKARPRSELSAVTKMTKQQLNFNRLCPSLTLTRAFLWQKFDLKTAASRFFWKTINDEITILGFFSLTKTSPEIKLCWEDQCGSFICTHGTTWRLEMAMDVSEMKGGSVCWLTAEISASILATS